jgi:hypothetical protein
LSGVPYCADGPSLAANSKIMAGSLDLSSTTVDRAIHQFRLECMSQRITNLHTDVGPLFDKRSWRAAEDSSQRFPKDSALANVLLLRGLFPSNNAVLNGKSLSSVAMPIRGN